MKINHQTKKVRLFTPGPVELHEEVLRELSRPIEPDYGIEWTSYYNNTRKLLCKIFDTTNEVMLFVGSGSSGIEACIGSALSYDEKILIGVNGFFGERLKEIAESFGLQTIIIEQPWGERLEPQAFEDVLRKDKLIKMIALVHLETSTTIVNPIEEFGKISKKYDVPLLVDTVSSLGGMPVSMDKWGIDFCVSASQKCLGAPPGLAPIAISSRGWDLIKKKPSKNHGWYLNLNVWQKYEQMWEKWHPYPITMAVSTLFALRKSLDILMKDGLENRLLRYQNLAKRLRSNLHKIGLAPYTSDDLLSPVITAIRGPTGIDTTEIVNYLYENYSMRIAGGLGLLKNKIFRIGHMTPTISLDDIDDLVLAIENSITDLCKNV